MLDLNSARWKKLRAYCGNASAVPKQIRAFQNAPSEQTFDKLRGTLTGEGDIRPSEAFYAALPHITVTLEHLSPQERVEYLCHLGWAIALAGLPSAVRVPRDLSGAHRKAVGKLRSLVAANLQVKVDRGTLPYLLGTMAATSGEHRLALGLIHTESVITCPKCGTYLEVRCPKCGKAFQCWPELFT
jgi:hypothetical protein